MRRAAASEGCLYDDAASVTSATTTMSLSEWGVDDGDQSPVDAALELMQVQPNPCSDPDRNPECNPSRSRSPSHHRQPDAALELIQVQLTLTVTLALPQL